MVALPTDVESLIHGLGARSNAADIFLSVIAVGCMSMPRYLPCGILYLSDITTVCTCHLGEFRCGVVL
jgi:hypothetical protein